ncbi:hypothetical protein LTR78_009716 [Recurvomyces mirabilis]|uniref:DSBA-like thioredoxin domain-containing protein n=1 Tax=Recurvomyces mirabilis TaxID=574656 RepID=A0AAE0TN85_9PEZI|nr:hypothetical protein LTR78_009716 [Recurvomyces mirabilis]KAK5156339.1 hypothetical protein LTS14_005227 [Recurvomyces mirabilis]
MGGHTIEFYYDISCPFAYIASTKIEALASRTGANLIWRPVLLGAIYRATSAPQGAAGSASDVFNATKKAVSGRAFQRTIKRHGIDHNDPPKHPVKTTAALRLLYFVNRNQRPALTKALFRAYWVEGKNVSDQQVLIDVVQRSGIKEVEAVVNAIKNGSTESQSQRKQLEESTDLAVKRGAPGVPSFWISDEVWTDNDGKRKQGRLYWGQDRMQFLEAVLHAMNEGKDGAQLGRISRPLQSLIPHSARSSTVPDGQEVKLEFWYDFSSPWAFLGWTQLDRLQRKYGSRLHIEMKPFLLGILFREIGAPNTPMSAISEQKRNYTRLDHLDWCRWWNAVNQQEGNSDKQIDFYWADKFPIRTPTVLRAVLVEPKLVTPLYRGCWEQNLDMSSDEVVQTVIDKAGFDGRKILAQASSDQYKKALRALTQEAKQIGLCGVPSYRVSRRSSGQSWKQAGDLVWGQDELAVVVDLISGASGSDVASVLPIDGSNQRCSKL